MDQYIRIPFFILSDNQLSDKAKILYGVLLSNSNNEHEYAYGSNKYYGKLLNCSHKTISRLFKSLKKCGYIKTEYKKNNSRTTYVVNLKNEYPILTFDETLSLFSSKEST